MAKAKRKDKQLRQHAAKRRRKSERPKRRWLERKAKNALLRIWQAWRVGWRSLEPTRSVIVGLVVLLAAGSQIYFSTWRMSVTPGEARNPSDPFSTMFVLHNEGQFAMHDITFGCQARDVVYENNIQLMSNVALESAPFNVARLEANARTSTPCWMPAGDALGRPLGVDASLFVSYRPSFSPFRRHAEFRFIARPNDKGGYSWTPMGPPMHK